VSGCSWFPVALQLPDMKYTPLLGSKNAANICVDNEHICVCALFVTAHKVGHDISAAGVC